MADLPKKYIKLAMKEVDPDARWSRKDAESEIWKHTNEYMKKLIAESINQAKARGKKTATGEDVQAAVSGVPREVQDSDDEIEVVMEDATPKDSEVVIDRERLDLLKKSDYNRYLYLCLAEANMELKRLGGKPIVISSAKEVMNRKEEQNVEKRKASKEKNAKRSVEN